VLYRVLSAVQERHCRAIVVVIPQRREKPVSKLVERTSRLAELEDGCRVILAARSAVEVALDLIHVRLYPKAFVDVLR